MRRVMIAGRSARGMRRAKGAAQQCCYTILSLRYALPPFFARCRDAAAMIRHIATLPRHDAALILMLLRRHAAFIVLLYCHAITDATLMMPRHARRVIHMPLRYVDAQYMAPGGTRYALCHAAVVYAMLLR